MECSRTEKSLRAKRIIAKMQRDEWPYQIKPQKMCTICGKVSLNRKGNHDVCSNCNGRALEEFNEVKLNKLTSEWEVFV